MDAYSQRASQDVVVVDSIDRSPQPLACTLCRRILPPDNDDLDAFSICGDCKFLLLEDHGPPTRDSRRRRTRATTARYSSSESIENIFSQQLSLMINVARQNQLNVSGLEDLSIDGDASARSVQHASTHTTPLGSRRWRRVLSDTESEGFDNVDSLYGGESETNVSLNHYRVFHGESDALSFSMYGGDSDASIDRHSILDADMLVQPDEESNFDSDTDIDPMHAGLSQWNSDELEEDDDDNEDEEEDGEWEEADIEDDTAESMVAGTRIQDFFLPSPSQVNDTNSWHRQQFRIPDFQDLMHRRTRQGRQTYNHGIFTNLEESELPQYLRNSGDYLDARRFEELLEHLAETDSSRRGAPPAAMSFVNSLPCITISNEHEKHDGLACAICKDVLSVGTEVNQLPCLHLYHPSCILPWLSARNSCPLCRYELPTDDKDYEEGKQITNSRMGIHEAQQQTVTENGSSDVSDGDGANESHELGHSGIEQRDHLDVNTAASNSAGETNRSSWFFLVAAAAPVVSLMGIVLVLWLGNPQGRGGHSNSDLNERVLHRMHPTSPPNQRGNRSRRWWPLS